MQEEHDFRPCRPETCHVAHRSVTTCEMEETRRLLPRTLDSYYYSLVQGIQRTCLLLSLSSMTILEPQLRDAFVAHFMVMSERPRPISRKLIYRSSAIHNLPVHGDRLGSPLSL